MSVRSVVVSAAFHGAILSLAWGTSHLATEDGDGPAETAIEIALTTPPDISEPPEIPSADISAVIPDAPDPSFERPPPPVQVDPPRRLEATSSERPRMPATPHARVRAPAALVPIHAPPPEYPRDARRRRHEGSCVVDVVIDLDGSVSSAAVVESAGRDALDEAALEAVRRWRYRPPEAVARDRVRLTFRLEN